MIHSILTGLFLAVPVVLSIFIGVKILKNINFSFKGNMGGGEAFALLIIAITLGAVAYHLLT